MSLYQLLVLVHVMSAILGMGPGFILIYVVSKARQMSELRQAFALRKRLHVFVMVGGTLLLLSGIAMGLINSMLFQSDWYVLSLCLFLIALAFGPLVLSPRAKPIKNLLQNQTNEQIPAQYYILAKSLFFYERIENVLFLIIISLMVLKPHFGLMDYLLG